MTRSTELGRLSAWVAMAFVLASLPGCEEEVLGPSEPIPLPARVGAPAESPLEPTLRIEAPPPQPDRFPVAALSDDSSEDELSDEEEQGEQGTDPTPQEIMRECNFANRCIAERLDEGPKNATTLPFLIEAYRNLGNTAQSRTLMEQYVRRFPTGAEATRFRRLIGAGPQVPVAPAAARPVARRPVAQQAPEPSAAGGATPQQIMRECNFANRCVVERLERGPKNSTTLPFLIEAYENLGNPAQSRSLMTQYVRRFPTGNEAARYQRMLSSGR